MSKLCHILHWGRGCAPDVGKQMPFQKYQRSILHNLKSQAVKAKNKKDSFLETGHGPGPNSGQRQQNPIFCCTHHCPQYPWAHPPESQRLWSLTPHVYSLGQVLATFGTQALHDNRMAASFQSHQKCSAG